MKTFAELGTVHRGEPCQEYPGEWLLYYPRLNLDATLGEQQEWKYDSLEAALTGGRNALNALESAALEYDPRSISICWKCSDNDPRVGQVWFTGFYQHGKFNVFGDYKS